MEIFRKSTNILASLMKRIILGGLILIMPLALSAQKDSLRINEFLALNQTSILDKNGTYSDWIELYNPTDIAVNLKGWSITDEKAKPDKWKFPEIEVAPGGYLVIFASNKDKARAKNELHTNFKLGGSGEYLGLYDNSGNAISEFAPSFPAQQVDISYGYLNGNHVGFRNPTPGKENDGSDTIEEE